MSLLIARSYAGDPTGNLTPNREGEVVFDTTNDVIYRANGLTSSDWASYSGSGSAATVQTWSPTVSFTTPGSPSLTYARQDGRYFANGNLINFWYDIDFTITSLGSAAGNLMTSLPATSNASALRSVVGIRQVTTGIDWETNSQFFGSINPNSNDVIYYTQSDNTSSNSTQTPQITLSTAIRLIGEGSMET